MPSSMRAATALLLSSAIAAPAFAHGHRENRPPKLPFSDDLEQSGAAVDAVAIQFQSPCSGCAAEQGEVGRLVFEFSADGADATCNQSVLKLNGQELSQAWEGDNAKGEGSLTLQMADTEDQPEVAASWTSHCASHKDNEVMQIFAFTIHSVDGVKTSEDFGFQIFLRQTPHLEIVNIEQLPLERDADRDDHDHEHHRHHGDHDDPKHLEKILRHEREELHHLEKKLHHLIGHIEHKRANIRKLEMNPRLTVDEIKQCSGLKCIFATMGRKGMMIFEYLGLSFSHGPPHGPPPFGPHGPHDSHGFVEGEVHGDAAGHHGPPGEMSEHHDHHHHPWDSPDDKWEHFGDEESHHHHHHEQEDDEFDHHRHHDQEEHKDAHHGKDHHSKGSEDKVEETEKKPQRAGNFDHHDHEIKPHDREHKYKGGDVKPDEKKGDKADHHREGGPHWHPNFNSGDGADESGKGKHGHDDKKPHHGGPPDGPHHHHNETDHPHHPPGPPDGPHHHHNETDHPHHPPGPPHGGPPHGGPPHGDHPPPPHGPPQGDHPHPGPPGPPHGGPHGFHFSPFHFFAGFLLLLTGAGLLFKIIRARLSPTRRALRAQMAEERRNARRARAAGRMHRWSAWWNRYREPSDRADYEEKAALILEQEGLLEEAMETQMEVAMAEDGRAPAPTVVEHRIIYTPRSDSLGAASSSMSAIFTPASSEEEPMLPSYEQELDEEIHVVDGFNYTPSNSGSDSSSLYHSRRVSVGTDSGRDEKR